MNPIEKIPGLKQLLDETEIKIEMLIGKPVKVYYNIRVINIRPGELLDIICEVCDVEIVDVLSPKRYAELVKARQIFSWFAYNEMKVQQKRIAEILGNRDHTTIVNALQQAKDFIDTNDVKFMPAYNAVDEKVKTIIKERISHEKVQTEIQA